ncbi:MULTISPECIES: class I SAM-dependent methyltransferase [unclassified Corynebacterium]|uniref:class I SAM-dependent methyltransferase n=1 Tax=Corynebacterium sp. 70RC1 TaxID=2968461 RepID=UPI00211C5C95|nr:MULTISPECIES: class I SAM-dependent methyltransferase [unclassified Corynebacterium]
MYCRNVIRHPHGGCGNIPTVNIPPISRKHSPTFHSGEHRTQTASAYQAPAAEYHAIRPSYPAEILQEALGTAPLTVADIGCGTGKLTEILTQANHRVIGVDPSLAMLNEITDPHVLRICATAEHTALESGSIDAMCCAQTWHWVDTGAASAEMARIGRTDAPLLLIWNTLDVTVPWVHRFTRISHSGDTLAQGFLPDVGTPWALQHTWRSGFEQTLPVEDLHTLMHTRSYWLRAKAATRAKMTANLNWYLFEHLGFSAGQEVTLPYRVDAFLYARR